MCCPQCFDDWRDDMSKKTAAVYEIRKGVYAYGFIGQKAITVVARPKEGAPYAGVRGVRPVINEGAKQVEPPKAAMETIERLTAVA